MSVLGTARKIRIADVYSLCARHGKIKQVVIPGMDPGSRAVYKEKQLLLNDAGLRLHGRNDGTLQWHATTASQTKIPHNGTGG